ncbi:UPF0481 protein At3g47200-like [Abrus precatorius]|uniref:UPF0481 protein At3g47200-like n=1 Tax=Abrus precatorius TaxID=3816 RepID=A0A8B8LPX9_ABRPR|nr:UPF0481 protein At3g47200-like [Abrus precatorius]
MGGQRSDSLSEQNLVTKLSKMLEGLVLPEDSGLNEQCIYKVPQTLRVSNPKAYTPRIVSIGPFHKKRDFGREDKILKPMEELKLKYLKGFLIRTKLHLNNFIVKLKELEHKIQSCYAGPIDFNSDDFLQMILIDACFIIEHFLRFYQENGWKEKDPLLQKHWLLIDIEHDLILLENQLPFFVLEDIYNLAGMQNEFPSFLEISFYYFSEFNRQNINPGRVCPRVSPKHFTDLLRTFLIPSSFDLGAPRKSAVIKHLYSASQLLEAGIKLEASPSNCLVDLNYYEGVLTMPTFGVHDDTEIYFRNILAFEHCHVLHSPIIIQYIKILDFLINTGKDVDILVDKKIIMNWMGDANAVATMVNSLGSNVFMPCFNSKYFSLCNDLNNFYENPLNKYKAIFVHEYFNTPWKIASTIAAIVLLLLTLIQTICSVVQLF